MKKEQIVDFTRRISQANRSGLVVVMYDIFFTYLDDARAAYDAADWDAYKEALRGAQRAIDELISALNFCVLQRFDRKVSLQERSGRCRGCLPPHEKAL